MKKILLGFGIGILVTAIAAVLYITSSMHGKSKEPITDPYIVRTQQLISMMYNVSGVNDLVDRDQKLKEYFTPKTQPLIDLTNKTVYLKRYGVFRNKPIKLTINTVYKAASNNHVIVALYSVSNGTNLPSDRFCIMTFDQNNFVSEFKEYSIEEEITNLTEGQKLSGPPTQ